MEKVVVDTDIIINHMRREGDTLAELLLLQEDGKFELIAPSVVVFEFYSGLDLEDINYFEDSDLLFSKFTVQTVDETVAKKAADLNRRHRLYQKIGTADILIAAACFHLDAKLATANKRHFALIPGLKFYQVGM